jgi:hypothetical protein
MKETASSLKIFEPKRAEAGDKYINCTPHYMIYAEVYMVGRRAITNVFKI